ncbi:hypothetical protein SDC9_59092 [bioreactor metagenome]|uniref:VTC domain-containing protein n=1 Tax=bioreactor metagenome TaxID=1076179 RepID=A0A644XA73_9ZZZZ
MGEQKNLNIINIFRVEKKYEMPYIVSRKLKSTLEVALKPDINNKENGYMVRSLYFDTIFDNDYMDKEDGIEYRKKLRLRTYDLDSNILKLELKEKKGELQLKRSLIISREIGERLINSDYSALLEINSDFSREIYYLMTTKLYKPKCIVEYSRQAFIVEENNTRITIDSNIKATEADMDIFSKNLQLCSISYKTILEVKYNNFLLSYIKDIVNLANSSEVSASKYCMARNIGYFIGG